MLKAEGSKNIAAGHHKKASCPRACELFASRSGKTPGPQLIERVSPEAQRCHLLSPSLGLAWRPN
jgi:hypothetical protein